MPPSRTSGTAQLKDAYRRVTDAIGQAATKAGRRPAEVTLVAVTKTASPDQIRTLVELGHADFGENRVQHLGQRVMQLDEFMARRRTLGAGSSRNAAAQGAVPASVRWHMIGHLQRNKVKQVVSLVRLIHSVDTLRLAEELQALGVRMDHPIEVLLQVNASGEESKFGIALPAAIHMAEQIDSMVHLRLRGLMTMAPYSDKPENARPTFARTADLFNEMRSAKIGGKHFDILSMGMSGDFEVAISEGANMVRIGRSIFGDTVAPDDLPER